MKMRAQHIVPLSTQAISILRELKSLTNNGPYVFPSIRSLRRPMSDSTILGELRRLGYS
jgi:integrase